MLALLQVTTPLSASGQSPHHQRDASGSGVNCSWSVLSLVHFGQTPTHCFFFLKERFVMKKERISVS